MQWLQDPNHSNVDNVNYLRREASRHCGHEKEYLETEIDEFETNSKVKNIRDSYKGINDF